MALLQVRNLSMSFFTDAGEVRAVNDVSFDLEENETLAIVGESGSGKTMTALTVLRLLPKRGARILSGKVLLDGRELMTLSEAEMCDVRGGEIAMIFQEPMSSLNPLHTIGRQITEAIRVHRPVSYNVARREAIDLLDQVGIPEPAARFDEYPHRLSGGMRQRAMIAMALSCQPRVLLADEPTTALDVTVQAQVMELLSDLRKLHGMSIVLITHDLGVVAEIADRVLVMYGGRAVEQANVFEIFENPGHPYTQGLISATPRPEITRSAGSRLVEIKGSVPSLVGMSDGCPFAPRCARAIEPCRSEFPEMESHGQRHELACHAVGRSV